jgi:hypothetical protein
LESAASCPEYVAGRMLEPRTRLRRSQRALRNASRRSLRWGGPSVITGGREQRASPSPFACPARPPNVARWP